MKDGAMVFAVDEYAQKEMSGSTDRGCAIIGGAYLEERLTSAIEQMMVRDKDLFEKLFRPAGPLGAFETKIRIAYMIGMITEPFMKDLMKLKEVRNRFAHRLDITNFEHTAIKSLINDFHIINVGIQVEELVNKEKCSPRIRFVTAIGEASGILTFRSAPQEFTPII